MMDTSEQYVNMCRMATELQEMWKPKEGDYFTLNHIGGKCDVYCFGDFILPYCNTVSTINPKLHGMIPLRDFLDRDSVWLPRTDQLIELSSAGRLPDEGFTLNIKNRSKVQQELLIEYYSNTYQKQWNGEDWI